MNSNLLIKNIIYQFKVFLIVSILILSMAFLFKFENGIWFVSKSLKHKQSFNVS